MNFTKDIPKLAQVNITDAHFIEQIAFLYIFAI